jgi:hypothetical protein
MHDRVGCWGRPVDRHDDSHGRSFPRLLPEGIRSEL